MDVAKHFGLTQDPFRPVAEAEQAFESRPFIVARQQVLGALLRGARLIAVLGGAGAGKSLLLRAIEKTAVGGRGVVRVDRADLADAALSSENRVLLLDDADALDDAAFAALVRRTTESGGPRVILACARQCLDRLPAGTTPAIVALDYLDASEARAFLADRVARAGRPDLFSPEALDVLAETGRGVPQALRVLGANALFHAAFDGAARVEAAHARQAAEMHGMWEAPAEPARAEAVPVAAATWSSSVAPAAPARPVAASGPGAMAPMAAAAAVPVDRPETPSFDLAPEPEARRSWWRSAPPLARLGILVGLLLLSLPLLGYLVGAIKDERPSTESSYLPDSDEVEPTPQKTDEAPAVTAAAETDTETPAATPPDDVAVGPPQDLTPDVLRDESAERAAPIETAERSEPAPPAPSEELTTGAGRAAEPVEVDDGAAAEEAAAADAAEAADAAVGTPDPAPAGGARVFVHYSRSQPGAAEAAAEVARGLRERGYSVIDIRSVPVRIEQASVRYFFPRDRAPAEALHDALGDVLRDRGFSAGDLKSMTGYQPSPRRGTIEVWVPVGS